MRHKRAGRKLGRNCKQRKALFKDLLNALLEHDKIKTTVEKAKTIRPKIERLITLAKTDTLHHRRLAFKRLQRKSTVKRLFETVGPRFKDRQGGYTRILRLGHRIGDGAEMAQIEMV
jgi:large subunit ribosomal protein L17